MSWAKGSDKGKWGSKFVVKCKKKKNLQNVEFKVFEIIAPGSQKIMPVGIWFAIYDLLVDRFMEVKNTFLGNS